MILVANPVINFVIYENLKKLLLNQKFSLNFLQLFVISSIAKSISTICTYPVLTVRVKMQLTKDEEQKGIIPFILKIVKSMGLEGLYIGFYAKLFQTVLYNAFMMTTYEKLRRFIKYLIFIYLKKRHII